MIQFYKRFFVQVIFCVHIDTMDVNLDVIRPGQTSLLPPHPRNQISNWYSYSYNDGISVDCEQHAKLGV